MSGPKVVRIVAREEIIELCYGLLARVDAALAEWLRVGQHNNCIDQAAIEAATQRRDALATLIATDQFMDLQKQAPIEEAFLRDDIQARLAIVAAEQAAARSRERREKQAATSLLRRLRELDHPLDPALEKGLERGEPESISKGFLVLAEANAKSSASSELAGKLRDETPIATFSEWLADQPVAIDPAIERIEVRLDELAPLATADVMSRWRDRLAEADSAPPARRDLLIDGLEVETGRALTEMRRRNALSVDLQLLRAELEASGAKTPSPPEATDQLNVAALEALIAETRAALEARRASLAAAARRAAVLEGLAKLGYEVTEGMSTSWEQDGRLVVRKATRPDYGVELSGAAGAERMQMRAVALVAGGRGPDPARDRDAETIWCGDVTTLQQSLAQVGGGLAIERALPVGATPLKRISVDGTTPGATTAAPALKKRTLR